MKVLGQPIFFHYLEVFFIERYKSTEEYANGTLKNFIMRSFSLLGEFIIRGSTVAYTVQHSVCGTYALTSRRVLFSTELHLDFGSPDSLHATDTQRHSDTQ